MKTNKKQPVILFLDIDGVLITRDEDGDLEEFFNPKCVRILNLILERTGAEIVISSDWRNHYSLSAMKDVFKDEKIVKLPFDYTPDLWTKNSKAEDIELIRTKEIEKWLKENNHSVWCAVDDMELNLIPFVLVDPNTGLTHSVKNRVFDFLIVN